MAMMSLKVFCLSLSHLLLLAHAVEVNRINDEQCNVISNRCTDQSIVESEQNFSTTRSYGDFVVNATKNVTKDSNVDDSFVLLNLMNQENTHLRNIGQKLIQVAAPFDASQSDKCSTKCKLHTQQFLRSLEKMELWAFQMHDATAKIPSGLLNGNVNQLGDFDQCLNVIGPNENDRFSGKYCLAYVQITVPDHFAQLKLLRKLVQSHDAFVNDFNDPGHRVPRFSTINWALCVPSTCTNVDVENALNEYLKKFTNGTSIQYEMRVEEQMCQTKEPKSFDQSTKIAVLFFAGVIAITVLSTLFELVLETPHQLLTVFSLWRNTKSLINIQPAAGDIGPIHGIRLFNAVLLLISHKSMALFYNPHTNRTEMIEALGAYISVVGRAAAIYTDVFLMFSGLLTSYSIVGRLQRNQPPQLVQEYVGRFLRIVPTFGALILFCTFILPLLGSGPQWNLVVNTHADICKENWWRNLLFIHNYFGFSDMCLTHTHHLGIDTELFLVAPVLILILWKWPKNGSIFLLALAILSTVGRFYITIAKQLSNYVYYGASIKQLFRTADYMYSIPAHRATIYILGILIGYGMRIYRNVKLSKAQIIYGWSISTALFLLALLGPAPMGRMDYKYNEYHAAMYAAFSPMAWCALPAWIVYTTHVGYNTIFSDLLSWRGFLISTRLSYAVYLTQFPLFFYNVGTTRHSGYYHFITSTINLYEFLVVIIASVVLTLFFDIPFQNIKKFIFQKTPAQTEGKCAKQQENYSNVSEKKTH